MIKWINKAYPLFFLVLFFNPVMLGRLVKPVQDLPQMDLAAVFNTCLNRVGIEDADKSWLYIPGSTAEMHTNIDYFVLAGHLIENGAVNAASCPAGGIGAEPGYANACGMAAARPLVVQLQNSFDDAILQAWQDVGVPPVLIKQLMRFEGQFYPGIWKAEEYGFGHLIKIGAQNALIWNSSLHNEVCSTSVGGECATTLLNLMDATCPTCAKGFNIPKAQKSIHYLAQTLLAYCNQTSQLVYNATKLQSSYTVGYATMWRLTLMNYNVGPQCVLSAMQDAYGETHGPTLWANIMNHIPSGYCQRGAYYSNQITGSLLTFPPGK